MFRKPFSSIMGIVIGKVKHNCVKITLLITKPNIIVLFIMTFKPVESINFNQSLDDSNTIISITCDTEKTVSQVAQLLGDTPQ